MTRLINVAALLLACCLASVAHASPGDGLGAGFVVGLAKDGTFSLGWEAGAMAEIAAKKLGRKRLSMLDTLVTPRTLLGWYRKLVAKKYDGTARRGPGGRRKPVDVVELVLRMARVRVTRDRDHLFRSIVITRFAARDHA